MTRKHFQAIAEGLVRGNATDFQVEEVAMKIKSVARNFDFVSFKDYIEELRSKGNDSIN